MDFFKSAMKIPTRPAPAVPNFAANKYSPVTNWEDDPFGADVFEPTPRCVQKKKPPPRPPPPKLHHQNPSTQLLFIRKPTVLDSLLSRRPKNTNTNLCKSVNSQILELNNDINDANKIFRKCEPKNAQTGTLIDLSSPPSSPTFTTKSSSDGLSIDSFGSDTTNSTNHQQVNCGNSSQAESGFEDDFEFILNTKKGSTTQGSDNLSIDPFSPHVESKYSKFVPNKPSFDIQNSNSVTVPCLKGPTIIRGKPARPKPPSSMSLLHGVSTFPQSMMSVNVNMTTPLQKVTSASSSIDFPSKSSFDSTSCDEVDSSPPMPKIPPPPPPESPDIPTWSRSNKNTEDLDLEDPYGIALFNYSSDHPDDLNFSTNAKIKLIRRIDQEWMFGRLRNGMEGMFPSNYIEIKVPLPDELICQDAMALYDFPGEEINDLPLKVGDKITILYRLNDDWYFALCNGMKGQVPSNYVCIENS